MNPNNALWGQLVRKTTTVSRGDSLATPPTAPLDKTGTSMRILLHDTQSNFERFSVKVDSLSSGIDDARREIVVVKELFSGAQETLMNDVVDVVNRCQTHLQTAIGGPAQASALHELHKQVDVRLECLSKRIDDMQIFNQTQSLTLQNMLKLLTAVQDQQNQILTALLPLQPLLQAVPVHIDFARSSINEAMLKMSLESSHRSPSQIGPHTTRKRSFASSIAPPTSPPLAARKKQRLDPEFKHPDTLTSPATLQPNTLSRHPTRSPARTTLLVRNPSLSTIFREANIPRRPLSDLVFSVNNSAVQTARSKSPTHVHLLQASLATNTPMTPPSSFENTKRLDIQPPPPVRHVAPTSSPSNDRPGSLAASTNALPIPYKQTTNSAAPAALKVTMVRGRRSPFRDGRRFIPLDDDDSGSDD
ncbi:hypothetical protein MIND_00755200 [Mycena indigotica]|uniref:Uncharacterized protein n=1 Tax=Mycena indigotica TaxID=2126181 RepID=A0A8H6W1U0_9AGAR|nr:uncharacterized protein MIND_00755200 [Mycena indigotica]KAF7301892.1 hypothetical protein MIND_00755200 [Mycena indigotica]